MQQYTKTTLWNLLIFLKWIAFACFIGLLLGGIGALFLYAIQYVTVLRTQWPWLLWLLPPVGILIVLLYKSAGMGDDKGTNLMLVAVRTNEKLSWKTAPMIFMGTVLTHLVGGSAGREGAALQMGGSIAAQVGRLLRLDEKDERTMTMCGMSAAFAAIFGTPIASAIFAMEVTSVGVMYYAAMVPCMVSSLVGYAVATYFGVIPTQFVLEGVPAFAILNMLRAVVLAILCAGLSILFCVALRKTGGLYKKYLPNLIWRITVGGLILIGLTYLAGTGDYNGLGSKVIVAAVNESRAAPEAFLMKILFTVATLGAGYKGGEIVPAFFVGATFGNVAGGLLGLSPSFAAGLGLIAVFCGVTNCPITSLFMSMELFGLQGLPFFAIACAVSYMLSGYYSLYSEQKILYSKLRPEFIDKKSR